ncbi:MAG: pseudouridine synthase [Gaiellales bacterium]
MRLNAYLARAGVASRRGADELIESGRVRLNGRPAEVGAWVSTGDRVQLDGVLLAEEPLAYVLLHKPAGVVTTAHDPQGRPTVLDLVSHSARLFPVGRLDVDTTGALLLTNDGQLANRLGHPRDGVEKIYVAHLRGTPDEPALERLRRGIALDEGPTAPAGARVVEARRRSCVVELTLHEGRKHQVKRMCEAVGHPVLGLHRSRYADLDVDSLEAGAWRELAADELAKLRARAHAGGVGATGDSLAGSPPVSG